MIIRSDRDLDVWQKGLDLAVGICRLAKLMPKAEAYRITSPLHRAAASLPADIAAGRVRGSRKEYSRHVGIARGSLAETETFLILAMRANLLPEATPPNPQNPNDLRHQQPLREDPAR